MKRIAKSGPAAKGFNSAGHKRQGDSTIMGQGRPGAAGESAVTHKNSGFGSAGHARMGDTCIDGQGCPGAAGECPVTK